MILSSRSTFLSGRSVTGGKKMSKAYDGNWGEMDEDFKEELVNAVEYLLKKENLVIKNLYGTTLNGKEYFEYVEKFFKMFQLDDLPRTQTAFESTVDSEFIILIDLCFKEYDEAFAQERKNVADINMIENIHQKARDKALQLYEISRKIGNLEHETKYKNILKQRINSIYDDWKTQFENYTKLIEEKNKKIEKEAMEKLRKIEENRNEDSMDTDSSGMLYDSYL